MKKTLIALSVMLIGSSTALADVSTNAITVNTYLSVINGAVNLNRSVSGYRANQTAATMNSAVQSIVATTNAILCPQVSTGGYAWFRNVGTQTVYVGVSTDLTPFMKLLTNDVALFRVGTTNLNAWTTTGTGSLDWWILND